MFKEGNDVKEEVIGASPDSIRRAREIYEMAFGYHLEIEKDINKWNYILVDFYDKKYPRNTDRPDKEYQKKVGACLLVRLTRTSKMHSNFEEYKQECITNLAEFLERVYDPLKKRFKEAIIDNVPQPHNFPSVKEIYELMAGDNEDSPNIAGNRFIADNPQNHFILNYSELFNTMMLKDGLRMDYVQFSVPKTSNNTNGNENSTTKEDRLNSKLIYADFMLNSKPVYIY